MPTPSSRRSAAASCTSMSVMPAASSESASAQPPIPPPTMTTFMCRTVVGVGMWISVVAHLAESRMARLLLAHHDQSDRLNESTADITRGLRCFVSLR